MNTKKIAFIGGGNMASSLVGGLINGGWHVNRIRIAEPDNARQQELIQRLRVQVNTHNPEAVTEADIVVLAVKPPVVNTVCLELSEALQTSRPLVVSIAAGIREPDIRRWLGYDAAIVRAMPNTPALVGSGATGLFANAFVTAEERSLAESVLRSVGITLWVDDESLMDAITAVSGSGPAYFFLLMEMLMDAGRRMGLKPDTAGMLAVETAFGTAKMALESAEDPATLRTRVTSPGGTTEQAINSMEKADIRRIVVSAVETARDRAVEIGNELGGR